MYKLVAMRLCPLILIAMAALAADPPNIPTSSAEIAQGAKLFQLNCALCHGFAGEGDRGPSLTRPRLRIATDDATLLKIIANGIPGTEMAKAGMSEHEVLLTAAYVRSLGKLERKPVPGDPKNGAVIYQSKGGCGSCHAIRGEGGVGGPELTIIGDMRSPAFLRQSIVDPSASVPEDYLLVAVTTKDGKKISGARVNEDSFSIQIRDGAGRVHSFWKKNLTTIDKQRGKSGMPSYNSRFTESELTDLVAYLASLRQPEPATKAGVK
jgi:cytochrome c oxidase cbb3-type subunit III